MIQSSQISVTGSSSSSKIPVSCISAITFDESPTNHDDHLLNKRRDIISKRIAIETNDDKQTESAEGSLYKRIMNGLNDMNTHDSNRIKVLNRERKGDLKRNEWRQVRDIHSDKVYFYNRQTRESSWTLPPDAAVLTNGKLRQMDKDENVSFETKVFPSEVSMTSEDKSNASMHSKVSDCYSSMLQKDHEESQIILERCRKLRNSFQCTERRKYFFPDTSRESNFNNENEIESPFDKIDSDHSKSSDENSNKPIHFYCMYCGQKIFEAEKMSEHLTKYHQEYYNQMGELASEYKLLKQIMINFWSENHHDGTINDVCVDNKENIHPQLVMNNHRKCTGSSRKFETDLKGSVVDSSSSSSTTRSIKMEQEHDSTSNKSFESYYEMEQNNSDEESTIFTQSKSLTQKYLKPSLQNHHTPEKGRDSNIAYVKSFCPFCNKSFPSGSNLSSHLLSCKQRQNSNRKRTNNNQKNMSHSRFLESGRKLPW
jgi:hypothetical protein